MNNKTTFLVLVLLSIIFTECHKKDKDQPTPSSSTTCTMASLYIDSNLTNFQISSGKLVSMVTYDQTQNNMVVDSLLYSYNGSIITLTDYQSGSLYSVEKFVVGSNGFASSETKITYESTYTVFDTTIINQNSDGYLTKISTFRTTVYNNSNPSQLDTIIENYSITDGNISSKMNIYNGDTTAATYQYYTDKENKSSLDLDANPNIYLFGLYGKANKNLLKGYTDSGDVVSYTYEYNSNGYVTKTTITDDSGGSTGVDVKNYSYNCQ